MKKWILSTATVLCVLTHASAQDVELEKWTYDGLSGLFGNAQSLTGTGSAFGGSSSFLTISSGAAFFKSEGTVNEGWVGGVSNTNYAGKTTGIYQISYEVRNAVFFSTGTGKAQFGWGLRSLTNGTEDCSLAFQYNNSTFNLIATDASGEKTPIQIATGGSLQNTSIRLLYNLNARGEMGSFRAYYTLGTGTEQEMYAGQLSLPSNFQLDEFRFEIPTRIDGNSWNQGSISLVDNLLFKRIIVIPKLTFIQEEVSYITTNGVLPGITYEPGDVLKIVTTNINETVVTVTDVSTSLSADASAFSITNLTPTTFTSLDPNEIYTATYQVEILDGATNGPQTFTVVNKISTGATATSFSASF